MAGIKISDLPPVVAPVLTDVFPIDQGAVTYKETAQQLMTLFESNIVITPTNFNGTLPVNNGGTGISTFTPFAVITAGTTATGAFQNVVGVGTAGQQLTSNGAGLLPSWQASGGNPLTTKGDLFTFSTVDARLPVGTVDGQLLQVSSGAATGLAWSTPTYPSASGTAGFILRSDGTNNVYSQATYPDLVNVNTILFGSAANTVGPIAAAQNGVLVSSNTNVPSMLAGPAATGRVLTSNAAAAPSWSTATFPSVGGSAGNVLISDGTNYISSTSLWPNTVGATGKVVISDGTSNVYSTPTFPNASATALKLIRSDGTNWVASTVLYPDASVTAGKFIISDGTNYIASTSIMPNTVGTAGKIIRSDGTVNAYSTSTFADTYGASTLLYANGANTVAGLATVNNGTLTTNGSGVPTWLTKVAITQVLTQSITATGAFTYTPTTGTQYAIFELQAGGGGSGAGGGGASAGSSPSGGGGGAYQKIYVTGSANLAAITGSVGAGGTAGAVASGNGGAGGDTTMVINGGTTWTSGGGGGGIGQAASGAIQISSTQGGGSNTSGTNGTLIVGIAGGWNSGGFISALASLTPSVPSLGGGSHLGGSSNAGSTGILYGGGGSAGPNGSGANQAGFAGGQGIVIVTEYISV